MTGTSHEDLCTFMISQPILLRMGNLRRKSCTKKSKHAYYVQIPHPLENRAVYEIMWKNIVE